MAAQLVRGAQQAGIELQVAGPVAVLRQALQPVGAQAFGELAARLALKEGLEIGGRGRLVGAREAVEQIPVAHVGVEHVAVVGRGEAREGGAIAIADRVAGGKNTAVAFLRRGGAA